MVGYYGYCNLESEKYYLERVSELNEDDNVLSLTP